jgi:hypothetical protein
LLVESGRALGAVVGSVAMSTPPLRADGTFRDEVVRIAELTVNSSTLEGLEFSNCRIIGPAVLVPLDDVTIVHCSWDAPGFDAIYWEVPPERNYVVGAVGVTRCTFSNCRFEQIGIAGPPAFRAQMERGFSES